MWKQRCVLLLVAMSTLVLATAAQADADFGVLHVPTSIIGVVDGTTGALGIDRGGVRPPGPVLIYRRQPGQHIFPTGDLIRKDPAVINQGDQVPEQLLECGNIHPKRCEYIMGNAFLQQNI